MKEEADQAQDVLDRLAVLEPGRANAPSPAPLLLARIQQQRRHTVRVAPASRRYAPAFALGLLLLGLAFSLPAVRAVASDFLGLFRVQKFAAISISAEQIALLQGIAEAGLMPGEFEILQEPAAMEAVASLAEAEERAKVSVRSLAMLGEAERIYVTGSGSGRLTIDLEGTRAILAAAGVDPALLPDQLEGQAVSVTLFPGVEQHWADGTWLLQSESPLVEYPDELDPVMLGQALLQLLGMNQEESSRLAQSLDWTSTLLLPVPQELATFNGVTVDGESGLALESLDGKHGVVLWQKAGIIHLLSSPGDTARRVSLANSLR